MRYIHHIENFPTKEEMSQAGEDDVNYYFINIGNAHYFWILYGNSLLVKWK